MDDSDINDLFVIPSGTPSARGEVDPNLVASIVEMGFSNHQAKYALKQVPTVAEAVEWLFANMDSVSSRIWKIFFKKGGEKKRNPFFLIKYFFHDFQLEKTENLIIRKYECQIIFCQDSLSFQIPVESAAVGLSSDAPEPSVTESATQKTFKDGGEKYKLIGMISHMGSRPDSGHYVAHMLKEGKWVSIKTGIRTSNQKH